jgi:hypothetical protein
MSLKQERAKARIKAARQRRMERRAVFLRKAAARRGMTIELPILNGVHPCHYSHEQVVAETAKVAGVQLFKSAACAGCRGGADFISRRTGNQQPPTVLGCVLVTETWMVAPKEVQVGQVAVSMNPVEPS